ncbi:unnamed protein product [Symbiodinium natans]|uniref:Uncharacterized protein n=1 Tax=Symbiodinium natans TaxID=878477 RepID=A0A812T845_9DINO|nr:unnamed protein product [Symbiodinium natans]
MDVDPDTGLFTYTRPQLLHAFVHRAREAMPRESFATNAAIFYWLSRASKYSGYDVDEDLLLQWTSYVRRQSAVSNESQLIHILQSLIQANNKNKLLRALELDTWSEMEKVVHELCREALPRLAARHQHLSLSKIAVVLSSYASVFRPEYGRLFEAMSPHLTSLLRHVLAQDGDHGDLNMLQLQVSLPFVLEAFARVGYVPPDLFDAFMDFVEKELHRITYENLVVSLTALAKTGNCRPSILRQTAKQVEPPCAWSTYTLARIAGCMRRLLLPGTGDVVEAGSALFRAAALEMLQRPDDWSNFEAAEMLVGLAALPSGMELPWEELIQLSCQAVKKEIHDFACIHLTNAFFGAVALELMACEDAGDSTSQRWPLAEVALADAVELTSFHLAMQHLEQALRVDTELVAQALLALAVRAPEATLERIGFSALVRVQQRELVRKAHDMGSGFARCAAYTTAAAWPWREEWLQPWFLEEVQRFRESQEEPNAAKAKGSVVR